MRARSWIIAAVVVATSIVAGRVQADSIYLRHGTVLRADRVWVEGDRVVFEQLGGLVAVPRVLVVRIVDDDLTGPAATAAVVDRTPQDRVPSARARSVGARSGRRSDDGDRGTSPRGLRQSWSDRGRGGPGDEATARRIAARRAQVEAELAFLERAHTAFFFSHRSTTQVKRRIAVARELLSSLDRAARDPANADLDALLVEEDREALLRFLDRAHAAFLFSHRSTAEVKERIRAARTRDDPDSH